MRKDYENILLTGAIMSRTFVFQKFFIKITVSSNGLSIEQSLPTLSTCYVFIWYFNGVFRGNCEHSKKSKENLVNDLVFNSHFQRLLFVWVSSDIDSNAPASTLSPLLTHPYSEYFWADFISISSHVSSQKPF